MSLVMRRQRKPVSATPPTAGVTPEQHGPSAGVVQGGASFGVETEIPHEMQIDHQRAHVCLVHKLKRRGVWRFRKSLSTGCCGVKAAEFYRRNTTDSKSNHGVLISLSPRKRGSGQTTRRASSSGQGKEDNW